MSKAADMKARRVAAKISRKQAADACGISQFRLDRLERGEVTDAEVVKAYDTGLAKLLAEATKASTTNGTKPKTAAKKTAAKTAAKPRKAAQPKAAQPKAEEAAT